MTRTEFVCQLCGRSKHSFKALCSHLTTHHTGTKFECGIMSCNTSVSYVKNYIRHIKLKHAWFWEEHWNNVEKSNVLEDSGNQSHVEDVHQFDVDAHVPEQTLHCENEDDLTIEDD